MVSIFLRFKYGMSKPFPTNLGLNNKSHVSRSSSDITSLPNQLRAVDIGNRFWCDIDTPQSLAYAERMLLAGLIQTPGSTTVSRWVKRPVS